MHHKYLKIFAVFFIFLTYVYGAPFTLSGETIKERIHLPEGFQRVIVEPGSFAEWLRNLPLKPGSSPVRLFNGELKANQSAHYAVIDMDIGEKDLQQCADAIIRLRGEYLYSIGDYDNIRFNLTNGFPVAFSDWMQGYRYIVTDNNVMRQKKAEPDSSYESYLNFHEFVMIYAGSYSLEKELDTVENITDMRIGDVFIQGGFPGHAVIVVDMAENRSTGGKLFLLAQSFMPAQDIHILKSFDECNPWYKLDFGDKLNTPEWTFKKEDLHRFK